MDNDGNTVLATNNWQTTEHHIYNFNEGNVGVGIETPTEKLTVAGTIETTTGGVKFPDGTLQITAATPDADADPTNELVDSLSISGTTLNIYESDLLQSIDLAPLTHNSLTGLDTFSANPLGLAGDFSIGSEPRSVFVQGNFAYIANDGTDQLEIIDISNAAAPALVGDLSVGSAPYSVFVQGNFAYIANDGNDKLEIVDVSNPAAPVPVSYTHLRAHET